MKPEIYTIDMSHILKARYPQEIGRKLLGKICVCSHIAYYHGYTTWKRADMFEDYVVFDKCSKCSCKMFKQDNLRYLESLIGEDKNA